MPLTNCGKFIEEAKEIKVMPKLYLFISLLFISLLIISCSKKHHPGRTPKNDSATVIEPPTAVQAQEEYGQIHKA